MRSLPSEVNATQTMPRWQNDAVGSERTAPSQLQSSDMRLRALWALGCGLLSFACSSSDPVGTPTDPATDPPPNTPPSITPQVPSTGSLDVTLTADKGAASNATVSFGLPFPQGVLTSEKNVTLKNGAGEAVPIAASVLAKWPGDGTIRSVLVAFKATLAAGANETWKIDYGTPTTSPDAGKIDPNPDGPVVATLAADFYAKSHVSGILLPVETNKRFSSYDVEIEKSFEAIDYSAFAANCDGGNNDRTYYDGPHAQYQRFLRTGDPKHLRIARTEAQWFRDNELTWYESRALAVSKCQDPNWTDTVPLDWGALRRMLSQGMLDDYLVTGDPAAKEAVIAMGEAYRRNLPTLTASAKPVIEITERNLGWPLMGIASYYALDSRNEVRDALASLVTRTIAWQDRGTSGGLEHDIVRPDPEECGNGPKGGSPFMTSLVADGMMDYWLLTADPKVEPFLTKLATWYEKSAVTSDKQAFRYLWNCQDNPYDDSSTADLNLLIVHVFGAAYAVTKDKHWLEFGDTIADSGIEAIFAKRPKQWNQSARTFGKYLGYRALGATP